MKSDIIFLDGIQLSVRIGTTEEERQLPQKVVVSLRLESFLQAAGRTDDLRDSVDYSQLERDARALAEENVFNLAEALAEALAKQALSHPAIRSVWVRVEKRVLKSVECVGVEIWRDNA